MKRTSDIVLWSSLAACAVYTAVAGTGVLYGLDYALIVASQTFANGLFDAVGNLFSLQKERAQALTCFRRAAQMDPSCAYAYTLSGHETIDEDLDKAIAFFQSALRADPRHYNAWYVHVVVFVFRGRVG